MPAPTLYILVPTKIQQAEQASLFPTRCGAKFALNPRYAKHHGLFHFLDTGLTQNSHRTTWVRQFPDFVGIFDTGRPQ